MLTWTPENSAPLFDYMETQANVSVTVTVETDDPLLLSVPVILGYTVTPNTLPDQVEIAFSGKVLEFSAPDLIGMLPILSIKYLQAGSIHEVFDFDDIPDDADQVLEYSKDPNSPRIFDLAVTASDYSGPETKHYELIVRGDYTPGRNRLILEVNERI
jgi:hypothetical protein